MSSTNNGAENYHAGAVTALAYMAQMGASKDQVLEVVTVMDLSLDDIDSSDREKLIKAYGSDLS